MRRIRTGLLSLLMVLTGVAATFADDDKAKRDRDAAAALDLQLALAKKAAVAAAEAKPDSDTRIVIGYCVGKHCEITGTLGIDAADTAVQAAFEAAVQKALKATKTDADTGDPLDEWSISAGDIDPETGGMFALAPNPDAVPPGWTCGPDGCYRAVPQTNLKFERPANCTCGEACPCVAMLPAVSAGSPMTMFAASSFRTIADRPRLFHFDGDGPVRRIVRAPFCVVGRLFRR